MDENNLRIKQLFFRYRVDQISKQYNFEVEYRGNIKYFKTSATLDEVVKNISYFIYLSQEQSCVIYTTSGLPKLEQKFELLELCVTVNGLLMTCKIKDGQRLKHREKNINKFRAWLKAKYGVRIEVEIND